MKEEKILIEIPEYVSRYNESILKKLYSVPFDVNDKNIKDYPFNKISKNYIDQLYSSVDSFVKRKVETIGMWMSGGADSSILAYLLCKKIKEENLEINFQPLSVRRTRGWNPIYAANVIDFICDKLKFDRMNDHIIYFPDKKNTEYIEISVFWEKNYELFKNDVIQVLFSGITSNPPKESNLPLNKERNRDDHIIKKTFSCDSMKTFYDPFININKKIIKKIYDDNNLTNSLFPLTRSCEGNEKDSGNFTYHCKKCWWCQERFWAFGKYE